MRNEHAVGELFNCDLGEARIRHSPDARWETPAEHQFDYCRCGHCGSHYHVGPYRRPEDIGGFCRQCMRAICPACHAKGNCEPLEKKLERAEARQRTLRSYGL